MKIVIFAGAKIADYDYCREYLKDADKIICCDAGMEHARALGIEPDHIVGDFDSVSREALDYFKGRHVPMEQFPTRKDQTDMQLGIGLALKLGATELVLFGGIGDRLDHTLGNAQLLYRLLKKGVKARLINEKNCVELIDKPTTIYGKPGDIVSTLPLTMVVRGVTLKGFSYPLEDYDLYMDDEILAVSNVMAENEATVYLKEGCLFVIRARD